MDRLQKILILCLVAGIPAAAPPFLAPPPAFCFRDGSVSYHILAGGQSADYRVRIDNAGAAPHLRIGLVDAVEIADFALLDDNPALDRAACDTGRRKTIALAGDGSADLTIALTRAAADADLTLFARSARLGHPEAAALLAVLRYNRPRAWTARRSGAN
jgi:hypothetical protein